METLAISQALSALVFGALSAGSLLLGAWTGIFLKPPPRVSAAVMAFGAGALFAALSLELIGEAVERLHGNFWPIGLGCVAGGLLFVTLDHFVNGAGGFLRKKSTLSRRLRTDQRRDVRLLFESLAKVPLFASLPPEEVRSLADQVTRVRCDAGTPVIRTGEPGAELYLVESGRLEVSRGGRQPGGPRARGHGRGNGPAHRGDPDRGRDGPGAGDPAHPAEGGLRPPPGRESPSAGGGGAPLRPAA